ncbi:MAG TPA: efflux RND transporter periplasmic adaptor subunit [Gemmataceae bacterium]|jgi:multidrug resistance efflux pump
MRKLFSRSGLLGVALVLVVGLVGGGIAFFWSGGPRHAHAGPGEKGGVAEETVEIPLKTVHPRYDKSFTMTATRPADVLPYFWTDLESRVAGEVKWIKKDIGNKVKAGETLVEVDVPELGARVEQRKAAWESAKAQVKQMEAALDTAEAKAKAAQARVEFAQARLRSDKAYLVFREHQAKRYQDLWQSRSISERLVDEQEDRRVAALEAVNASTEAVTAAKADKIAAEAKIKEAAADVEGAKQNVNVTKAERDHAKAMLDFSTIEAAYDGEISRRYVSPGSFVQNASNGQRGTPILSLERRDIVTVVMQLPDRYAPFVTPGTEAIIKVDALPGLEIHGAVTRFARSLVNNQHDLTMRVEVELWNGTAEEFQRFVAKEKEGTVPYGDVKQKIAKKVPFGDLKAGSYDEQTGNILVRMPKFEGPLAARQAADLLPGMYARMTLVLRKFDHAYLLPSAAIDVKGGFPYIWVVRDDKAYKQPVRIQVDDGKLVKVELLNENGEVKGELTGKEEVIVSNQGELSEGQPVKPTRVGDWGLLDAKKDKR